METEAWYRTIFETSGTAMIVIEEDATISLANDNAARLAGFTREEAEGKKKWTEFVVKEDLERMKAYHILRRTDPDAPPKDYEFRLIDRYGQVHDILLKINMIPRTKKSIVSLQDITALKSMERQLKESEENYKALFENALEGVFQVSTEGRFLSLNPAIARMHGFSSPEEMKSAITDIFKQLFVKPEDIDTWKRLLKEKDMVKDFEALQYKKDGTYMWVSLNARAVRDENGRVLYYTGYVEDITKRKEVEEGIKRLQELESSILKAIPHAVLGLKNRIITFANDGVRNVFGYAPEELIGKSTRILYRSDEDYKNIEDMFYPGLEKERV
ncbi:MAG TPA: PAS domain S-box protein, partial [Syntrophorhabdaceae bacterium]|nr:PAS domain S-box protein [Syntrophorhabdaceae bacterium]